MNTAISPAQSEAWKCRENARFYDGTYKAIPVDLAYPSNHYAHLSVVEGEEDAVAYTPSETYGAADRQVRLKFGRYLKKAFLGMADAEIQAHVTTFKAARAIANAPLALQFATDRDTVTEIFETPMYAHGSHSVSCMCDKFTEDIRPYHVYADSPDVAVAYFRRGDTIQARSVVSTLHKRWIRLYSHRGGDNDADCGTLQKLLEDEGYTRGSLLGNRLTMLQSGCERPMLPYLDGDYTDVDGRGYYWMVVDSGDYTADSISGSATENGNRCGTCNSRLDDCECSTCDCCGCSSPDGCDYCGMCDHCDRCTTHGHCSCAHCDDCDNRLDDCECDRCETCGVLVDDCECAEEDDRPIYTCEPDPDAKYDSLTIVDVGEFLNRVYVYLRDTHGRGNTEPERIVLLALHHRTRE